MCTPDSCSGALNPSPARRARPQCRLRRANLSLRPRRRPPFHPGPEASTRTVQNVLFVLGGLLLGTAAIVFTAVAWSRYGVTGRAVILAVVTALALLTPPIALWRRLTATAETFAAVGLLLVVLDGYAAWYVNLFGVQSIPATRYSGMVAIVTAGVALAYRLGTRLVGPGLVALAAVQPVLPLLLAGESLGVAEWSLVFAAVALLDLSLLWGWRSRSDVASVVMRAGAWFFFAAGLLVAAIMAYVAELVARDGPDAALAGVSVVVVGLLLVGGAMVTRSSAFQALAGCGLLLTVVAGAGRFVDVVWPRHTFVLVAAVVTVTAVLAGLASRLDTPVVPAPLRSGLTAGGLVAAGGMAAVVIGESLAVAGRTMTDALPIWRAALEPSGRHRRLATAGRRAPARGRPGRGASSVRYAARWWPAVPWSQRWLCPARSTSSGGCHPQWI